MHAKARLFGDDATAATILQERSDPRRCAALGQSVAKYDETVWLRRARDLLEAGLFLKFAQDRSLATYLLATGKRELVHASPHDAQWGIGLDEAAASNTPRSAWGHNWLGQVLMRVRSRLVAGMPVTPRGPLGGGTVGGSPASFSQGARLGSRGVHDRGKPEDQGIVIDLSSDEEDEAGRADEQGGEGRNYYGSLGTISGDPMGTCPAATAPPTNAASVPLSESQTARLPDGQTPTDSQTAPMDGTAPSSAFPGADGRVPQYADDPVLGDRASLVPRPVSKEGADVVWSHQPSQLPKCELLVRRVFEPPRTKVAGFDVDGTLLRWIKPRWPATMADYELWNANVPLRLRRLHAAGYKIVLFGNRGNVQGAVRGPNAEKTRGLADWIAHVCRVPVHALFATKSSTEYYKPRTGMWTAMERWLNEGVAVDASQSFFVGDLATDREWVVNVSKLTHATLGFELPAQAFGAADGPHYPQGGRAAAVAAGGQGGGSSGGSGAEAKLPPPESLAARRALLGGYLQGPRMIVLCGPQGAGKSHFCAALVRDGAQPPVGAAKWLAFSQDSITKAGKPGKREQVECPRRTHTIRASVSPPFPCPQMAWVS